MNIAKFRFFKIIFVDYIKKIFNFAALFNKRIKQTKKLLIQKGKRL